MHNRKKKSNSPSLVAHTTLMLEAMRYVEDLFSDDNAINSHSGWKTILRKTFDGKVTADDISDFVDEVCEICKKEDADFCDFDKAHVCASIFTRYRCTIDDSMLGFILKSKTVMDTVKPPKRWIFAPFHLIGSFFGLLKRIYNGFLDSIKIG